jgi:hypothetical protein
MVTKLVVLIGGVGAHVDWWGGMGGRIRVTRGTHSQTPLAGVVPSNQQVLTNLQMDGSCGATKAGPKVPGREGVCVICCRKRRQRGGAALESPGAGCGPTWFWQGQVRHHWEVRCRQELGQPQVRCYRQSEGDVCNQWRREGWERSRWGC